MITRRGADAAIFLHVWKAPPAGGKPRALGVRTKADKSLAAKEESRWGPRTPITQSGGPKTIDFYYYTKHGELTSQSDVRDAALLLYDCMYPWYAPVEQI